RRAHQCKRLRLRRRADFDLIEGLLIDLIAAVEVAVVADAPAQRAAEGEDAREGREAMARAGIVSRPHGDSPLRRSFFTCQIVWRCLTQGADEKQGVA